jgi:hypothetical protein
LAARRLPLIYLIFLALPQTRRQKPKYEKPDQFTTVACFQAAVFFCAASGRLHMSDRTEPGIRGFMSRHGLSLKG